MTRPIYRLTAEAEDERADFVSEYGYDGNCSCHLSPPCSSCTHPGNPHNQAEDETAWEPDPDQVAPGFKRLWSTPRRCSRGGLLDYPTPQQRYLRLQSLVRYRRRPDAYPAGQEQLKGELGYVDGFRFITSPALPDPDHALDAAAYLMTALAPGFAPIKKMTRDQVAMLTTTPDGYQDRMRELFERYIRFGTGAIMIGMDFGSEPAPGFIIRPVDFYSDATLPAWRPPALYTPAWRTWLQQPLDERTAAAIALVVDRCSMS